MFYKPSQVLVSLPPFFIPFPFLFSHVFAHHSTIWGSRAHLQLYLHWGMCPRAPSSSPKALACFCVGLNPPLPAQFSKNLCPWPPLIAVASSPWPVQPHPGLPLSFLASVSIFLLFFLPGRGMPSPFTLSLLFRMFMIVCIWNYWIDPVDSSLIILAC